MTTGASLLVAASLFISIRAEAQAIVKYSGTAVANEIDVNGDQKTVYTVTLNGRGAFGGVLGQAHVEFAPWDQMTFCDATSVPLRYTAWSGAMTYNNGDQLYLELSDGVSCFNFIDGSSTEQINLSVMGGTGRFEGATGSMVSRNA